MSELIYVNVFDFNKKLRKALHAIHLFVYLTISQMIILYGQYWINKYKDLNIYSIPIFNNSKLLKCLNAIEYYSMKEFLER